MKTKGRKAAEPRVSPRAEKEAIKSTLDRYVAAVEHEDIRAYGRVLSHDSRMVNFGTDASERIVGWDSLQRAMESQFVTLKGAKIAASDITITLAPGGQSAWATSQWDFKATMGAQTVALPVRCTWVLEKRRPNWVIVHFHKSVGTTA